MAAYKNNRLTELLLELAGSRKVVIELGDKLLPGAEPGYTKATSKYGRAHFFAPYKRLGNWEIDTFWFNFMVLWMVSIILYAALYFNLLRKLLNYFETLRFQKSEI
jgi:hypothetical protein